jgi:hypothetical protein
MDLILCSAQRPGQGYQAGIALAKDYRQSPDQATFRAAVQRILALRASLRH